MKFNMFFTLSGPGGIKEVPNTTNPVEAESMMDCLRKLSDNNPISQQMHDLGLRLVGVRILEVK